MVKTNFVRVATEGATTDGRNIERTWLEDMAANYNPATYTARINMEHIKGFSPDAPFNAYGSVLALKAEEFDLAIDGKTERRLGLYAQLDANDNLVAAVKAGQKIFTSIEITPDFAGTKKFGLVGLAVTDTPASLGCEALKFSALKPVFDAHKASPENMFSEAVAVNIQLDEPKADPLSKLADMFTVLLNKVSTPQPAATVSAPLPAPGSAEYNAIIAEFGEFGATYKEDRKSFASLRSDFDALKASLSQTERPNTFRTDPVTGAGSANTIVTNC